MRHYDLNIEERSKSGKGPARQVRARGRSRRPLRTRPVNGDSVNLGRVQQDPPFEGGEHALLSLREAAGREERLAIVKEVQTDPVYGKLIPPTSREVALTRGRSARWFPSARRDESSGVKLGRILQHEVRRWR